MPNSPSTTSRCAPWTWKATAAIECDIL
jgi:hypothetical protein